MLMWHSSRRRGEVCEVWAGRVQWNADPDALDLTRNPCWLVGPYNAKSRAPDPLLCPAMLVSTGAGVVKL